jgi:hypothetical protein
MPFLNSLFLTLLFSYIYLSPICFNLVFMFDKFSVQSAVRCALSVFLSRCHSPIFKLATDWTDGELTHTAEVLLRNMQYADAVCRGRSAVRKPPASRLSRSRRPRPRRGAFFA